MNLLQRYILWELLRVFTFVLSVLTVLLVFVGVFQEARANGLGPVQILEILPFVIPSTLPFTIPATLLLTVCVVYGRISGDLEITAAKAAGINVFSLLWPSFALGGLLTACSFVLTDQAIPWAVSNIQQRVTNAMEDIFLDVLRTRLTVAEPDKGFSVTVTGVEGRKLIHPTFQYTPPGQKSAITIQAQEATLDFDLEHNQIDLHLIRGYVDVAGQRRLWFQEERRPFPLPLPSRDPKPRQLSIEQLDQRRHEIRDRVDDVQTRLEIETAFAMTLGDFHELSKPLHRDLPRQIEYDVQDMRKFHTEIHSRYALSASCFFFAILGGPFAILQGRRQFLTSFFLCFLPILVVYYPLVLLMMNLSKTGTIHPGWGLWVGNAVIGLVALVILHRVLKH